MKPIIETYIERTTKEEKDIDHDLICIWEEKIIRTRILFGWLKWHKETVIYACEKTNLSNPKQSVGFKAIKQ
jgi:hypothetical protein